MLKFEKKNIRRQKVKVSVLYHRQPLVEQCNPFLTVLLNLDQVYQVALGGEGYVSGLSDVTRTDNGTGHSIDDTKSSNWTTWYFHKHSNNSHYNTQRHYFITLTTHIAISLWQFRVTAAQRSALLEFTVSRGSCISVQCIAVNTVLSVYRPYLRKMAEMYPFALQKPSNKHVVHCKSMLCTTDELTGSD